MGAYIENKRIIVNVCMKMNEWMNEIRTRWIISLKDKVNSDGTFEFAWLFNLRCHVSCGGFPGSTTTLIQIKNKGSEWLNKIIMDRS